MTPSPMTATSTADIWFHRPPLFHAIMIRAAAAPAENRICDRPVATMATMRLSLTIGLLVAATGVAAANDIPLPRPRPAELAPPATAEEPSEPSACQLRLSADRAIFQPLPSLTGPGGCGATDVVRLEAVVMPNHERVALTPAPTLRCSMAEAVADWVREEVGAAAAGLGAPLRSIENFDSYDCRGTKPGRRREVERARQGQCARRPLGEARRREGFSPHRAGGVARFPRAHARRAPARASRPCSARAPTAITRSTSISTWPSATTTTACANGISASPGKSPTSRCRGPARSRPRPTRSLDAGAWCRECDPPRIKSGLSFSDRIMRKRL